MKSQYLPSRSHCQRASYSASSAVSSFCHAATLGGSSPCNASNSRSSSPSGVPLSRSLYVRVKCKRFILLFKSETNGRCSYRKTYLGYNQIAAVSFFLMCKGHLELRNIFILIPRVALPPLSLPSFLPASGTRTKNHTELFLSPASLDVLLVFIILHHTLKINVLYPERFLFLCIYCIFC